MTDDPADEASYDFSSYAAQVFVRIEQRLAAGEEVSRREIAKVLRSSGDVPLPPLLRQRLYDFLVGKGAGEPRGRPPMSGIEQKLRRMMLADRYHCYLAWLQQRRKRYGHLKGWRQIREADFWQGSPAERAARMTARAFGSLNISWRAVQNIVSSSRE